MRRGKTSKTHRSEISVVPEPALGQAVQDVESASLDMLSVEVQSLRLMEDAAKLFMVKITFHDQLILRGVIKSITARAAVEEKIVLSGNMFYDPSDYEKMSLMADFPLCVQIQPIKRTVKSSAFVLQNTSLVQVPSLSHRSASQHESIDGSAEDISCCNVDIIRLLIDKDEKRLIKRLEPFIKPSVRFCKSWDNLPMISMIIKVTRNEHNQVYHKVLKEANFMQITLIAAYNMLMPHDDEYVYTAASKMPVRNETDVLGLVTFNQGYRATKRFDGLSFYPKWESLRVGDDNYTQADVKFDCTMQEIQNDDDIPLERYMDDKYYTTAWGSLHRTLMLQNCDGLMLKQIRRYQWPLEVHIYGDKGGYSFMAFMNLFKLLYPGEDTVRIAVPLRWINADTMQKMCGCDLLLTPNDKASSTIPPTTQRVNKSESPRTASNSPADAGSVIPNTGSDENDAFIVVEVKLARPLRKVVIPPYIPPSDINDMLKSMEQAPPNKRECSGRGQLDRDWQSTIRSAAISLRKVPYYGMTEFCSFHRQLSETRTRVELITSCWQDAAVYINNNFVVQDFLRSEDTFEEMLMMAHACLMRTACTTLVGVDNWHDLEPTLRAARHARQLQDTPHAMELFLQLVVQNPRDANCWRELSTCMKDVDKDWANVCINKSIVLNPRHPLSLLSKGCMLFEENPSMAEPFFVSLLALFPFWATGWIITSAYYHQRELFHMAEQVVHYTKKTLSESKQKPKDLPSKYSRGWEHELGDWWDFTPILPGMSPYYDAADLLLRLRAITLAETCVALALADAGESAPYFHLVALCCRLRGNIEDALCHIHAGIKNYGEISYLRSLEAECYQKQNNPEAAKAAFEKAGSCICAYSTLLSSPYHEQQRARTALIDLVRRQPSAYAWMALADDWMARAAMGDAVVGDAGDQITAKSCAAACATQALKWDRRASQAWCLLSKLVKPSARRLHCLRMAWACGYMTLSEELLETDKESKQSLCHHLSKALTECRCKLCEISNV